MPREPAPADPGRDGSRPGTPPGPGQAPPPGEPDWEPVITRPDPMPAGFAGRINLTIPLPTLLGLAERPGEIPGIGPIETTSGARCTSSEVTVPLPHPVAAARAGELLERLRGDQR